MPAYNQPNEDKRLKQDDVEREKKARGSMGMLVAVIVILIAIIAGAYMYNRTTVETGNVNQENNVVAQPVSPATTEESAAPAPTESMPSSTESMSPTTSDTPTSTTPADVTAPSDVNAQ